MADTNGGNAQDAPANGGNGTGSSAPAPSGENTQNSTQQNTAPGGDPALPKTYTEAEMKVLRDEAASNRVKAKKAEDRLKEIDDASKTDQQKQADAAADAVKRAEQAESQLAAITRKQAITAAVSAVAVYPDVVAGMITPDQVPNDPATNAPDAKKLADRIAELRTAYPGMFKATDQGGDAGAGGKSPSGSADMNTNLRKAFGR